MKPIREIDTTSLDSATPSSQLFVCNCEISQCLMSLINNNVSFAEICQLLERVSIHIYYFNRSFPAPIIHYQNEHYIDIKSVCYALSHRRYSYYHSYSLNYRITTPSEKLEYHVISGRYLYVSLSYFEFMLKEHIKSNIKYEYTRSFTLIEKMMEYLKNRANQIAEEIVISPDSLSIAARRKLSLVE